ncbi:MAG TPA: hypothetical protein VGR87_04400 [Candidatus Limnocylindria bacterium]|jgi:hypothetical protein|nr:hypothetical protein [Candidatus Limnocylindria bacterium]
MVDALESVRKALRPSGVIFDLQPDAAHQPTVAVRDRSGRHALGPLLRETDEDVLAAHAARDGLVRAGRFSQVAFLRRTYRTSVATLAAFDADRRSHTPTWRLARGVRPRLLEAWRAGGKGAGIETTRRMSIVVLRRRGPRRSIASRSP